MTDLEAQALRDGAGNEHPLTLPNSACLFSQPIRSVLSRERGWNCQRRRRGARSRPADHAIRRESRSSTKPAIIAPSGRRILFSPAGEKA
jgi:hypothetical protein